MNRMHATCRVWQYGPWLKITSKKKSRAELQPPVQYWFEHKPLFAGHSPHDDQLMYTSSRILDHQHWSQINEGVKWSQCLDNAC